MPSSELRSDGNYQPPLVRNVVVAGGRDYALTTEDYWYLKLTLTNWRVRQIFTDGTPGFARLLEAWAIRKGIDVKRTTADWLSADDAPISRRNTMLARMAGAVILFPGDEMTTDLELKARAKKVVVVESPSRWLAKLRATRVAARTQNFPRLRP